MKTFVLLMLFWNGDHGSSLAAPEFNSRETCIAAKAAAEKEMNSSWATYSHNLYAVCVEK